jgi:hypothetical protein
MRGEYKSFYQKAKRQTDGTTQDNNSRQQESRSPPPLQLPSLLYCFKPFLLLNSILTSFYGKVLSTSEKISKKEEMG